MLNHRSPLNIQKGFTLLELLVGIGLMVFILGSGVLLYSTLIKSYYDLLATNKLDQQLRSAINMMSQDIRRAGYSANAQNDINSGSNTNSFMTGSKDISVPNSSCILFTYDTDSNGALPALNSSGYDEHFGYRLSGTTLQSRNLTDAAQSCTSGTWVDITDRNQISISNLQFVLASTVLNLSGGGTLSIRNVTISLSGNLSSDSSVTRTITETIRVRNDKYQP